MSAESIPPDYGAVEALARALDLSERLEPFARYRWTPGDTTPVLHVEDVSAIPFLVDIPGVDEYQHRARVRAQAGDLYATVTPPDDRYEAYCVETLRLSAATWVDATTRDSPLAVARACLGRKPFAQLVEAARASGGLRIHPYMSIEDIWTLAEALSRESGYPVSVIGSPPPVTWIANDKALFTTLVERVLGSGWTTETHESRDPAALGRLLQDLGERHPAVGLKRTRCASAMGNLVLESASIRDLDGSAVVRLVIDFLKRTEWTGDEDVLVVAWESAVSSPSTQWWLPPVEHGHPRLDGIYEQILEGDRKVFVGSRPSTLPAAVNRALEDASRRVAHALQHLGYVGRCSFDHLVIGDPTDDFSLRFTECNGRWGGTSTPMHLVDRVVEGPRPPYRAQDVSHEGLTGITFGEILESLGDDVFDQQTQTGRYIFYNLGPLAESGKLDVIATGRTQGEAEQALLADLPRRLAL